MKREQGGKVQRANIQAAKVRLMRVSVVYIYVEWKAKALLVYEMIGIKLPIWRGWRCAYWVILMCVYLWDICNYLVCKIAHPSWFSLSFTFVCQAVADIIRTTLGPRSMLKMLLDAAGGILVFDMLIFSWEEYCTRIFSYAYTCSCCFST